MRSIRIRSAAARMLAVLIIAVGTLGGLLAQSSLRPARAQELTVEFRETLGAYGRWVEHPRWGAVWLPDGVAPDWRPYRSGHWVYTDEWGWYWVADEDWGWIAYHYGRWVFDRDVGLGWIWVPGTEWSPAWVTWRRGEEAIGWAPMPPDEIYVSVQDEPDYWLFVRGPDFITPSLAVVILPAPQALVYVRETVIINQTIVVHQNNTIVVANPGVPPSFVAAKVGRPIQTVSVQPHVLAGTVGVTGAVVGPPRSGLAMHEAIKPQPKLIQPAANIPPPTPFRPGQPPKLGPDAPNALKRANLVPSSPASGGAAGQQPQTSRKPLPALSSQTPNSSPGIQKPPSGNLQSGPGPKRRLPTGTSHLETPAGTQLRTPTGLSNAGPQGPSGAAGRHMPPSGSADLPRHPGFQATPNLNTRPSGPGEVTGRSQPNPRINGGAEPTFPSSRPTTPQSAVVHQPPSAPQHSATPPQHPSALMHGGAPNAPGPRPNMLPQGAAVHQPTAMPPSATPRGPTAPPQQHPQKCQTINGQQVCR